MQLKIITLVLNWYEIYTGIIDFYLIKFYIFKTTFLF